MASDKTDTIKTVADRATKSATKTATRATRSKRAASATTEDSASSTKASKVKTSAKAKEKASETKTKKATKTTKAATDKDAVKVKVSRSKAKTAASDATNGDVSDVKMTKTAKTKSTAAKSTKTVKTRAKTTRTKAKSATQAETDDVKDVKKTGGRKSATTRKAAVAIGKTLVIVESPEKARTINSMLGKNYLVRSSKGHIRDLPRSRMAIDIEHDFQPEYIIVKGKAALKNELMDLAQNANQVILASDPDREGEAIAWHLATVLGIDMTKKCRVRFYEITANAVKNAIKEPDLIDMNRVNAQQARRILDRLVGYSLSPLLWKKIRYGLSAGRVQSVALNLLCEREREIQKFIPDPYWVISVRAKAQDAHDSHNNKNKNKADRVYDLKVDKLDGKSLMKGALPLLINTEELADEIVNEIKSNPLVVTEFRVKESKRKPPAPLRTSTLQQEASRRIGMSGQRTMRIAQSLYEGVIIPGRGHTGLITYMRTDSLRLSDEALEACREFILNTTGYGEDYLPPTPNHYAAPARSQDAHEAIRPTDVTLTPESIRDALTPEQFRIYELIWQRFVASQMTEAITAKAVLHVRAGRVGLKQEGETLVFDGWSKVWKLELKGTELADAVADEVLIISDPDQDITKEQKFTRPPARYSEASLIKTLEDNGVGRPSTYATIAGTLDLRGYVERTEDRHFQPTALGLIVDEFLKAWFNRQDLASIIDTGFTAQMESELDEVEEARRVWLDVVRAFWTDFEHAVQEAQGAQHVVMPAPEPIGEDCPDCGKPLVKRSGRFGEFIGCSNYPECHYTRPILKTIGVPCPICGSDPEKGGEIVRRRSKKGRTFYGCSRYPDCDYVSWDQPTNQKCPECGEMLHKRGKMLNCPACGYKAQDENISDTQDW